MSGQSVKFILDLIHNQFIQFVLLYHTPNLRYGKWPPYASSQSCWYYLLSKDADITAAFAVLLPELYTLSAEEYEALHEA